MPGVIGVGMGGSPHKVTSFLGADCHNLIFYQTVNFGHRTNAACRPNLTATASRQRHPTKEITSAGNTNIAALHFKVVLYYLFRA
jgi:hypothetical protein